MLLHPSARQEWMRLTGTGIHTAMEAAYGGCCSVGHHGGEGSHPLWPGVRNIEVAFLVPMLRT